MGTGIPISCRTYEQARPIIRTGDVILWRGRGLLSRIILRFSDYSHASIVIRPKQYTGLQNRVFLLEALSRGFVPRILSERIKHYRGEVFWLPLRDATNEQRDLIAEHAITSAGLGIQYDWKSLILNVLGYVNADARRMFCSEAVYLLYRKAKLDIPKSKAPRPGDIAKWKIMGDPIRICNDPT